MWAPYTHWQTVLKGEVILRQKAYFSPDYYTLQIVQRKRTLATIHETTWQRCVAKAKVENLKVVEPIGDLGWGIPAFQLGHFNQTAFHLYQMAMIISVTVASTLKTTKILETHISQLQGVSCDIDRTVVVQRKAV